MPFFTNETINGLHAESGEPGDEEEFETGSSKRTRGEEMFAAAMGGEYATLPYPIVIDSGVAESVLPKHWCPQPALRRGQMEGETLSAGRGSSITHEGGNVVSMIATQGQCRDMTSQACDVTRQLASVSKIVEAGHSVVFNPADDPRGSYTQTLSGRR